MDIAKLLSEAKEGNCPECNGCPWNPQKSRDKIAFGVSCKKHAFDWSNGGPANSFSILRDPGNTTPANTGTLCGICNSKNATDQTAQHGEELWRVAVALKALNSNDSVGDPFIKKHYNTNCIMHGSNNGEMNVARQKCKYILKKQIEILKPSVIYCCGQDATTSLFDLKLLSKPWSKINHHLSRGAYIEEHVIAGKNMWIACTYHSAAGSVNRNAARRYDPNNYEKYLEEKLKSLPDTAGILSYLKKYNDMNNKEHKGLRVLLLHMLDIGALIRESYKQNFSSEKSAA